MMASFDTVNYSLRPSKNIQRQLVFAAVRHLQTQLDLEGLVYVGFGSIWFSDFLLAHKLLGIRDMVSIEAHEIGYKRACFNSPYATVRVREGQSNAILPELYGDEKLRGRPWFVWLDYDYELNESIIGDLRSIVENVPANSIFAVTFNGHERKYGAAPDRVVRLKQILGAVVPDSLAKGDCKDEAMQETLATLTLDYMASVAADISRPGGFAPAFRIVYRDNAPMITVGGILPTKGATRIALDEISKPAWPAKPPAPVKAPHLTSREAAALQAKLPSESVLTRADVQALGFDLEEDQLTAFQLYYREYPSFAQVLG
jgi:hypothetical protein